METINNPSTPGLAHEAQAEAVSIVRTVCGGTMAMRSAGKRFLPRFPREDDDEYAGRLGQAVLFNATARTVEGLAGMVFTLDPKLGDDVPAEIRGADENGKGGHWENIDAAGRHGAVFAKDVFKAMLTDGHSYVLVDYPPVDASVRSRDAEQRAGLRPYWTHYLKQDLLSFRMEMRGGSPVLTQVVLRETATEYVGAFGEKAVEQVRVYQRPEGGGKIRFQSWQKSGAGDKATWAPIGEVQTMALDFIPLVPWYANRTGFQTSDPPLLDLALENIAHYQVRSDRRTCLHIASVPIPVFIGLEEDDQVLTVSTMQGIKIPKGGDAKYLEPEGAALAASRTELQDILQNMAALGLAMLQRETRAAETAEAKRIDKSETDSRLSSAARGLQDGIEACLAIHARWLGLADGGSCTVNREFESQTMEPMMVKALSEAVGAGQLSMDTMWDVLQKGGVLPDHFDADIEHGRIMNAGLETPAPELREVA